MHDLRWPNLGADEGRYWEEIDSGRRSPAGHLYVDEDELAVELSEMPGQLELLREALELEDRDRTVNP